MTTTDKDLKSIAENTAQAVKGHLNIHKTSSVMPDIGIILGTGFGDKLSICHSDDESGRCALKKLPCFRELGVLEGHKREYAYGYVADKKVLALSGRIHLYEEFGNPDVPEMVRLQTQIMMEMEIKTLIVTCAVGALPHSGLKPGDIMIIDSLLTLFAPPMPLFANTFPSPEDILDTQLMTIALNAKEDYPGQIMTGTHAMVRGPFFEGRKKDKSALSGLGAKVVGMSFLPELCIAALYKDVRVLGIAFVTNGASEIHSHQSNIDEANKSSEQLGKYLERVIRAIK